MLTRSKLCCTLSMVSCCTEQYIHTSEYSLLHTQFFYSGHVIISGCGEGMVAISNPSSGLVVRMISDHQGAPITDLQASTNSLMVPIFSDGHIEEAIPFDL